MLAQRRGRLATIKPTIVQRDFRGRHRLLNTDAVCSQQDTRLIIIIISPVCGYIEYSIINSY